MVVQCKNLISLYILPDQRRVNLLVDNKVKRDQTKREIRLLFSGRQFDSQ